MEEINFKRAAMVIGGLILTNVGLYYFRKQIDKKVEKLETEKEQQNG